VKLWGAHDGRLMHVIAGNLTCSEFSPDSIYFVTGDETGSLKFWGRMIKKNSEEAPQRAKVTVSNREWKKEKTDEIPYPGLNMKSAQPAQFAPDLAGQAEQAFDGRLPDDAIEVETKEVFVNDQYEIRQVNARQTVPPQAKSVWDEVAMPEITTEPEAQMMDEPVQHKEHYEIIDEQNEEPDEEKQKQIEERIRNGECYICGKPIGVIAKLAGSKLCYKHSLNF
jgi:RNA polymerase-binding transcription factor DksA